jgi:hypothetical protein
MEDNAIHQSFGTIIAINNSKAWYASKSLAAKSGETLLSSSLFSTFNCYLFAAFVFNIFVASFQHSNLIFHQPHFNMAPIALETEDHARDAAFNKAMHGTSAGERGGMMSMIKKDKVAQKAAVDEYFKHWDNKGAAEETPEVREARRAEYATLTRHYYNLATDLYEYGWGASFHFCRFAYGESFRQAIARHEHYLAHVMNIKEGMTVLDVGCGVGGPAREIAKFTGCKIVGLNNNDYQIERATRYAAKEGLSNQLSFTKGDFMVGGTHEAQAYRTNIVPANAISRQHFRRRIRN